MKILTVEAVAADADARLLRRLERELARGWPPAFQASEVEPWQRRALAEELALEGSRQSRLPGIGCEGAHT